MEGLLMVANCLSNNTNPTIVPTKPNKGAMRAITDNMVRFFSILYISSLPTLFILFSIASMGLPIRCSPLSIILATGLSVFLAKLLAAVTFPFTTWSRIILIKFSPNWPAFLITRSLSIKK